MHVIGKLEMCKQDLLRNFGEVAATPAPQCTIAQPERVHIGTTRHGSTTFRLLTFQAYAAAICSSLQTASIAQHGVWEAYHHY